MSLDIASPLTMPATRGRRKFFYLTADMRKYSSIPFFLHRLVGGGILHTDLQEGSCMDSLLGFKPDLWDLLAIGSILGLIVAGLIVAVFVLGLPGRIAISRNHPEAEAVNLMGWAGFLTIVPWIKALGWAFKPTDVVDIRYFPKQEQRDIEEQIATLKGKSLAKPTPASPAENHVPVESEPKG
jgi:hypothetical protein